MEWTQQFFERLHEVTARRGNLASAATRARDCPHQIQVGLFTKGDGVDRQVCRAGRAGNGDWIATFGSLSIR